MRKARFSKEAGSPCALSSLYRSTPLISDSGSLAWFEGLYLLRYCDWKRLCILRTLTPLVVLCIKMRSVLNSIKQNSVCVPYLGLFVR